MTRRARGGGLLGVLACVIGGCAQQPELVLEPQTSITPSVALLGCDTLHTTYWVVHNTGNADAAPFQSQFLLSTDASLTVNPVELTGATPPSPLAAGGQEAHGAQMLERFPPTLTAGSYFAGIRVDVGNAVAESDESNNVLSVPITIQAPRVISLESYPTGSGACADCALGSEFSAWHVSFGFLANGSTTRSAARLKAFSSPGGSGHGATAPVAAAGNQQPGELVATFSPPQRCMDFTVRTDQGPAAFAAPVIRAVDPNGATLAASTPTVVDDGMGRSWRFRVNRQATPVAELFVGMPSAGIYLDELRIAP